MDAINSSPTPNSVPPPPSLIVSGESVDKEEEEPRETEKAEGYASDSESDFEQPQNEQVDSASTSSRGSSSAESTSKRPNHSKQNSGTSTKGGRSSHGVSFSRNKLRQTERRMRFDGQEVTMVTLDTQTDWDWLQTAEKSNKAKILLPSEAKESPDTSATPGTSLKSILVKSESRETTSGPRTELGVSSAGDSRTEMDFTPFSLLPNDEYGIPLMEMSSTSDDSSDEEAPRKKRTPRVSLPSVGPPQILKYVRESENPDFSAMAAAESSDLQPAAVEFDGDLPLDEDGKPAGIFNGPCEFCSQPILPMPTLEMQHMMDPSNLYCCEDYREFIQFATSAALRMEQEAHRASQVINVKVHPHHGSKQARRAAKERAVERMRQREQARRQQEALGSHGNFHSSRENVASSRPDKPPKTGGGAAGGVGPAKDSAVGGHRGPGPGGLMHPVQGGPEARQMKTINYQLSSQRCLEEGWTLRPPSPVDYDDAETEIFVPEPLHPAMIASGNIRDRPLVEKFYPNGDKFLTIFPDGTGNVLYPSGRLAILISSVALGQYTYIVQDDTPQAPILAIFDPHGFCTTHFLNGNIKLYYDQLSGLELDASGARRRRWTWNDSFTHVHAPPFQPITTRLNARTSLRVMTQQAVALTFQAKKRSCRFNVGTRLKLVSPQLLSARVTIDEHQLFIDERATKVQSILNKVSLLLKFPKSPKVDKILPPLHISAKMDRQQRTRKELSGSRSGRQQGDPKAKSGTVLPAVSVN